MIFPVAVAAGAFIVNWSSDGCEVFVLFKYKWFLWHDGHGDVTVTLSTKPSWVMYGIHWFMTGNLQIIWWP